MAIYPNQKNISFCSKAPAKNGFIVIKDTAMRLAMVLLTGERFKVWMYYEKNSDGFVLNSGPAAASRYGVKKTTLQNANKDLEDLGYLNPAEDGLRFCEVPNLALPIVKAALEEYGFSLEERRLLAEWRDYSFGKEKVPSIEEWRF